MREATSFSPDTTPIDRLRRLGVHVATHTMPPGHRFDDCAWLTHTDPAPAVVQVWGEHGDLDTVCLDCAPRRAESLIEDAHGRAEAVTADIGHTELPAGTRVRHLHTHAVGTVVRPDRDLDDTPVLVVLYDQDRYGTEWSDDVTAFAPLPAQVWVALHELTDGIAAGPFESRAEAEQTMCTDLFDDVYIAQVDRTVFERASA